MIRTEEFVFSYYDGKDASWKSFICDALPLTFAWNKETNTISMNVHGNIAELFEENEVIPEIRLDITDDPTLDFAGGIVSLGYYILRVVMKNAKFNSDKGVMVFSTRFIDGFSFRLSRPARRHLEFPEKKEGFSYTISPFMFSTAKQSNLLTLVFGKDHSNDWKFVNTFLKEDYSLVGRFSPMSLFFPIEELRRGKSVKESSEVHHNKLIQEVME